MKNQNEEDIITIHLGRVVSDELYDALCEGIPVGGILETAIILQMIEDVKNNRA